MGSHPFRRRSWITALCAERAACDADVVPWSAIAVQADKARHMDDERLVLPGRNLVPLAWQPLRPLPGATVAGSSILWLWGQDDSRTAAGATPGLPQAHPGIVSVVIDITWPDV